VQVSVWDSEEHAAQMNRLNEMAVDARGEMTAVGVTFSPMLAWRRALISEAAPNGHRLRVRQTGLPRDHFADHRRWITSPHNGVTTRPKSAIA
jgi:hypothetical protein